MKSQDAMISTVLHMCRDMTRDMEAHPELSMDTKGLVNLLDRIWYSNDRAIVREGLYPVLEKLSARAMEVYARMPENRFADSLYRRLQSLIEMVKQL